MQKKITISIITVVAVALVAALTLLMLLLVHRATGPMMVQKETVTTQTAQSVITQLQKEVAAHTILKTNSVSLVTNKQSQTIAGKDAQLNKYVQVTATNGAFISQGTSPTEHYTEQQLKTTTNDLTTFLAKLGLSTTLQTNDTTALLTVSDKDLICQLKTLSSSPGLVSQIQLLCINKSSYTDQVSVISHLTSLWKDASSTRYDQVSLETTTKDQYTIAQLFAIPSTTDTPNNSIHTTHILLFVKTNDTWTYIGDAGAGTSVVFNEKYVINQSVKDGLDNPHYGSFLHDVLFGPAQ